MSGNQTVPAQGGADPTSPPSSTGRVFISADSLTFPTAAAVCAALVNSFGVFSDKASHNVWIVLGVAVVVGAIIIVVGWPSDTSTPKQKWVYAVTGLLNILLLFASTMGLTSMATQSVPGLPS